MFDYDHQTDPHAIIGVADAIRGSTALKPQSDEERLARDLEREIRLEENWQWHEERRRERESAQAEAKAAAQREHDLAAAQAREQARVESRRRSAEQARERELSQLRLKAASHEAWQRSVERYASNAVCQQTVDSILGELDQMINSPEPPPEPEPQIVYVEKGDRFAWGELPRSSLDFRKGPLDK